MASSGVTLAAVALILAGLTGCGGSANATSGSSECGGDASCADGPANPAGPDSRAATPLGALSAYLTAAGNGDCATAERFALRSAFVNGDLCVGTQGIGPLGFDQWRNPLAMPSPSCCVAYAVELHITKDQTADATVPRWAPRAFTLQRTPAGYLITAVGTINGEQ
ncbi:hypothetical protein Back2_23710 [Nocardioides baekrokdamisoli]|uniref:Lipoprotein n=1 Tax=Nocardioides baekrokdamisoli TaxID=1804624 RepID=A0A3G9J3S6_9ACTN|nr:hypothetical protein [Nocardioides baekrokdamisoli]BBH18084.1 hypothetical protein Back2_23710 [Nocardioides baekrokdamisoli]